MLNRLQGFNDPSGTHFTKGLRSVAAWLGSSAAFLCYWANVFVDGTTRSCIPGQDIGSSSGGFNYPLVI